MGRTVAQNANAMLRSTVKTCLVLAVMARLSWELTALACLEILLLAALQKEYIRLSTVGGATGGEGRWGSDSVSSRQHHPPCQSRNGRSFFFLCAQSLKAQIQDCCAHADSLALQALKWIQVVRSFRAEELERRRYGRAVTRMQTLSRRKELYGAVYGFARRVRRRMEVGGDSSSPFTLPCGSVGGFRAVLPLLGSKPNRP